MWLAKEADRLPTRSRHRQTFPALLAGDTRRPLGIIQQIAAVEDADTNLSYADRVKEGNLPPGGSPFLVGGMRLAD